MNRPDTFERELVDWFVEAASPRVPDYTDDILRLASGTRQRPRWSFPDRWLPSGPMTLGRRVARPLPWRTMSLLAALGVLVAMVGGSFVGSLTRVVPPFGPAANGLVAYADDGHIFTVHPGTGERTAITGDAAIDSAPRWSLDGTRLAFLREAAPGHRLVIVDPNRPDDLVTTDVLPGIDTDGIEWSPDGSAIMFVGEHGGVGGLHIVDTTTGLVTNVPIAFEGEAHWRPPDGRQLMFVAPTADGSVLRLLTLADRTVTEIARPAEPGGFIRPTGWTPDGRRAVYMTAAGDGTEVTHVVDLETGDEVRIAAAFAHVSNDGTRVVGLDRQGSMCVAPTTGGDCVRIGMPDRRTQGTTRASVDWSPDDRWILVRPDPDGGAVILDPAAMTEERPAWLSLGGASWQRRAP